MNNVQYTCQFSDPLLFDGTMPTNPGQQWQFYKETCTYNGGIYAPTTTIESADDISVYASFTAGEILTALLMFVLIVIELIQMLARALANIKTRKTFIRYTNNEAEISDNL